MNLNRKAPPVYKPASRKIAAAPPVYHPQAANQVPQPKRSNSFVESRPAPPVYRPNEIKNTNIQRKSDGNSSLERRLGPPVYRPQSSAAPANLQRKQLPPRAQAGASSGKPVSAVATSQATVQQSSAGMPKATPVRAAISSVAQARFAGVPTRTAAPAHAGVVQCRYDLAGDKTDEDLLDSLLQIDKTQLKQLGEAQLTKCLAILKSSAFYHGRIDIANEQIVGLLYFQAVKVNRRFSDRWEALSQDIDELGYRLDALETRINLWGEELDLGIFNLAIIGAGSAAAYYIDTLGSAYDHSGTLLIGGDDPWAGRRGEGIDYINHATQQINYPSEGVQDYSETFVKRTDFASRTKRIIEDAIPKKHRFKGAVLKISQEEDGKHLLVIRWRDATSGRERTQRAKKVVVAAGAGPHMPTTAEKEDVKLVRDRVMDMDTFIRDVIPASRQNVRSVVSHMGRPAVLVQGPNAAIDAVAAASIDGWDVYWVIRSTEPQYLKGTRYALGRIPLYKTAVKDSKVQIKEQSDRLQVTLVKAQKCTSFNHQNTKPEWGPEVSLALTVDYFVYGIGQDINSGGDQPAAGSFLDPKIKEKLELIHHRGGRYSKVTTDDSFPDFAEGDAVGLHLKGSGSKNGLEIIGATAKALSGKGASALDRVATHQSADIMAYEQLGGIRSAMYGLNESMPSDIGTKVDFSHADPTTLRAHLAIKYPYLAESDATRIINNILDHRKTGHHPHGYTQWWLDHWQGELTFWNKIGRIRKGL